MFFLASSKLLPRTMTESFSQTPPAIIFGPKAILTLDRTSASPMAKVNESAQEVPTRKTVKHMFDPRLIENVYENASEHN